MSFSGLMAPFVYWKNFTLHNGTIGIIGGADAPTHTFMLWVSCDGLPIALISLGICLVISAVFCLIFSNTVKKYCNIKTSLISLGLSCVGAIGLVCVFIWFSIVSFGEMSKHPIEYPVSVLLGIVCFFAFVVLIAVYLKLRKTNWSIKGLIIDILTSIIYLPTFFYIFSYIYGLLN